MNREEISSCGMSIVRKRTPDVHQSGDPLSIALASVDRYVPFYRRELGTMGR